MLTPSLTAGEAYVYPQTEPGRAAPVYGMYRRGGYGGGIGKLQTTGTSPKQKPSAEDRARAGSGRKDVPEAVKRSLRI